MKLVRGMENGGKNDPIKFSLRSLHGAGEEGQNTNPFMSVRNTMLRLVTSLYRFPQNLAGSGRNT